MNESPSPNGKLKGTERTGRDARGRFGRGNPGGPGNPHAAAVGRLRAALIAAITEEDIAQIARTLMKYAHYGNVGAIRELLNRVLGPPVHADLIERLERLERAQDLTDTP